MNNSFKNFLIDIYNMLYDHYKNKYIDYTGAINSYLHNRNLQYKFYSFEDIKCFKKSDTIFILGSGPSLNDLTQEQVKIINRHDSFGINYSFLLDDIVPTFYQIEYGKAQWAKDTFKKTFGSRRNSYKDTIFFLSNKALYRMAHPRVVPDFFPENPKICYYKLNRPITLDRLREFTDDDFNRTVYYRGTLTLVLDFVVNLGYSKIVLLGVDPDKCEHFFDGKSEMVDYVKALHDSIKERKISQYENMVPKGNKYQPIDNYLYSLHDYLFRVRHIELFVAFKSNMFSPKIPAFFD